jgi:hypothetical protein
MSDYFAIKLEGLIWTLASPIKDLTDPADPAVYTVSAPLTGTMLLSAEAAASGDWQFNKPGPEEGPTSWVMGDAQYAGVWYYVYVPPSVSPPNSPVPYLLPKGTTGTAADAVRDQIKTAMENGVKDNIKAASGPFPLDGATLPYAVVGHEPGKL